MKFKKNAKVRCLNTGNTGVVTGRECCDETIEILWDWGEYGWSYPPDLVLYKRVKCSAKFKY
jgi:hypothetical protein